MHFKCRFQPAHPHPSRAPAEHLRAATHAHGTPMRRAISARHSERGLNPGKLRACASTAHQRLVVERAIQGNPQRLQYVPRRVDEQLEPGALGIKSVDGDRVAVSDRNEIPDLLGDQAAMHLAQGGQAVRLQRQLVDDIETELGRPAAGQYDLMMFIRITAGEYQIHRPAGSRQLPAVGHRKAEHPRVEILHPLQIMDPQTDVAQGEAGPRHRLPPLPIPGRRRQRE